MKLGSLNLEGIKFLAQWLGYVTVLGVAAYCDLVFLNIVSVIFPVGFLKIMAAMGAIANFLAVLVLMIGKATWFRPGKQLVFSWILSLAEIAVMVLNVIMAFSLHNGSIDGWLKVWYDICPASPVVSMVGIFMLFQLDQSTEDAHLEMEFDDKRKRMELQYKLAVFKAEMDVKHEYLNETESSVKNYLSSSEHKGHIAAYGKKLSIRVLTDVTGMHPDDLNNNSTVAPEVVVAPPGTKKLFPVSTAQLNGNKN